MRRFLALSIVGLCFAGPALSQEPCSLVVHIPVNLAVAPLCPGQPLNLIAAACGPCVQLLRWEQNPGQPIGIYASMNPQACILTLCQPESLAIPIGSFAPGHHQMLVDVFGTVAGPDSTTCSVVQHEQVTFDVPMSCPPPQEPLPYTEIIRVGPASPCATCPPPPICPGREIAFFIAGHFTDNCVDFRGLELLPSPIMSPLPQPPIARVTFGFNDCMHVPCVEIPGLWQASALMPGLPAGDYQMIVEVRQVSWCDSNRVISQNSTLVPFSVAADCSLPPAPSCYLYGWRPSGADAGCNTRVGPGTPGRLFMDVSGIALAGLQGRLAMTPPALRLSDLRLVGPGASGMRLLWRELADGASFVAFQEGGPICAAIECPWSIEMTVSERPGVPIPAVTTLEAKELLATDASGRELPLCPTFAQIAPARICKGRSCDMNGDGAVDVRDLVLMVRCLRDPGACPDSSSTAFDCDGDGGFDLDDVLCCARVILGGHIPDSVAARPTPELRVALGAPATTASGVDVPVRVTRADLVGAARLALSYPSDRFGAARVELLGDASQWLTLSEVESGEMVVGLIATSPQPAVAGDLDLMLHFELASGQQPSTAIQLVASEFAGHDGARLSPSPATNSVPDAAVRLTLSAARPNPFDRETRFALAVSRATDADVAVFDLGGRRMATLHHGRLEAGEHAFRWAGASDRGDRARDGVYFYRAVAQGVSATRKLVLLRAR